MEDQQRQTKRRGSRSRSRQADNQAQECARTLLTADNCHSAILLTGVVAIINWGIATNMAVLTGAWIIVVWALAYYGLVNLLPDPLQP